MIPHDALILEATYRPAGPELEVEFRRPCEGKGYDYDRPERVTFTGEEARSMARELFPKRR